MQLTHVTKYKLSQIIGDEGESHKAMGNPTLGCIGILCSTTDIQSTIITQTDLDCVCQNLSVSRLLSCDMEHCRVCKGVWCQQHLALFDLGCYLDHTFLYHCHKASVLPLILVFKQALHNIWLKQYVVQFYLCSYRRCSIIDILTLNISSSLIV